MSTASALRARALSVYRRIHRHARTWHDASEADYMRSESQSLFRRNRLLADDRTIEECIFEAESRLDLAVHYNNPYPRLYNTAPDRTYKTQSATNPKTRAEIPAYMRSYYAPVADKQDEY